jgi:DNA polymerase (family 10)
MSLDNYALADQFSLLSKLMDIHGENPFKSRSYATAAFTLEKLATQARDMEESELSATRGIGASIAQKIRELLETGELQLLKEIIANTPPGVIEMLSIKGIGPKKIATIWKEMGIESTGELLYACEENRLMLYKGFGAKTQENIKESIEFYNQQQGRFLYSEIEAFLPSIEPYLKKSLAPHQVALTGAFRRQDPVIDQIEYITEADLKRIKSIFQTAQPPQVLEEGIDSITYQLKNGLKLKMISAPVDFEKSHFLTTADSGFHQCMDSKDPNWLLKLEGNTEEALLSSIGIAPCPPCLWNKTFSQTSADIDSHQLIQPEHIKGIIHSHSNWSDGSNTLEEMAEGCIARGFEYLVISDHSKTASYAGGLSEEKIREQHKKIDDLNQRYAPFKIFKSIESDILGDGSLDYSDEVLASFDLVIASVHSNLKMSQEKAMMRLTKAIENPYTTILGHMTGRLLLSRNGYPVDHEAIIETCAQHGVVIELNAHPRRLDIDWEWIPLAIKKGVLISINPDAHALEGFDDCKYGVLAAQKGGLTPQWNLSSMGLAEFQAFLNRKKNLHETI